MLQSNIITSPLTSLSDLFLDGAVNMTATLGLPAASPEMDRTFSEILSNNLRRMNTCQEDVDGRIKAARLGPGEQRKVPKTGIEELEQQVDALGLPLDSMSLSKNELARLQRVLEDEGLDKARIEKTLNSLAEGPLTLGRVMAVLAPLKNQVQGLLTIKEDTLPFIGHFLQDLGFGAQEVKDILNNLKSGQRFGAEAFRQVLLKQGSKNLQQLDLSQVDMNNLQTMLKSLGIKDGQLNQLLARLKQNGGRMSMEGFLAFLKSAERPHPLDPAQMDNINQLIKNIILSDSLRAGPYFNRIISLLQAMGDGEIDEKFMSENAAVQALRDGASPVKVASQGTGTFGQGAGQETGRGGNNDPGQGLLTGSGPKTTGPAGSTRSSETHLPSRLADSVVKQVAEKIFYQAYNNQHRLRLQLSPPELGRVEINLYFKDNGLQATIIAENPLVKEALEQQVAQLRDSLAQQGLNLERFDVSTGRDQGRDEAENRGPKSLLDEVLRAEGSILLEDDLLQSTGLNPARGRVDLMA